MGPCRKVQSVSMVLIYLLGLPSIFNVKDRYVCWYLIWRVPGVCSIGRFMKGHAGVMRCHCPPQFTGQRCETAIQCASPCINGGFCQATSGAPARCICPAGFTGKKAFNLTVFWDQTCLRQSDGCWSMIRIILAVFLQTASWRWNHLSMSSWHYSCSSLRALVQSHVVIKNNIMCSNSPSNVV